MIVLFAVSFFKFLSYAATFVGGGYVGYKYGKHVYEVVEGAAKKF